MDFQKWASVYKSNIMAFKWVLSVESYLITVFYNPDSELFVLAIHTLRGYLSLPAPTQQFLVAQKAVLTLQAFFVLFIYIQLTCLIVSYGELKDSWPDEHHFRSNFQSESDEGR